MVDIFVKDLVKSFEVGKNLLDGLSFEVQQGERVGLLGKNGAGKTTVFRILTDEIGYDEGTVEIASGKKVGLISQIPRYPEDFTVERVLRCAFSELDSIKKRMEQLESQMAENPTDQVLRDYDKLTARYQAGGGYDMDVNVDKICNGLGIPTQMRGQRFSMLSGGEKTRGKPGTAVAGGEGNPAFGRAHQPPGYEKRGVAGGVSPEVQGHCPHHLP